MGFYIELSDIENRMTARVVAQIFDDDQDDGMPDAGPVADTIADAESYFEDHILKNYGQDGVATLRKLGQAGVPRTVKRLCLDATEYMMYGRHPDYIRGKWEERKKNLDEQLEGFRMADFRLDTEPEAPTPANTGGIVESGNTDDPCKEQQVFLDSMGDFSL